MSSLPPLARHTLNSRWSTARPVAWIATALGALACGSGDEREFENMTVVAQPGGYGGAPASAESTCAPHGDPASLAVDAVSRQLSWEFCHFDAPDFYTPHRGRRVITEEQLDSIQDALGRLTAGTAEDRCGPDGGVLTLDVRTEATTELYIASSNCPPDWSAGRTLATGIGDLWLKLRELSGE